MKQCPKCGSEEFAVSFSTHDTIVFSATIDEDYSMDTIDVLKKYPGDCDFDPDQDVECAECGKVVYSDHKWEV